MTYKALAAGVLAFAVTVKATHVGDPSVSDAVTTLLSLRSGSMDGMGLYSTTPIPRFTPSIHRKRLKSERSSPDDRPVPLPVKRSARRNVVVVTTTPQPPTTIPMDTESWKLGWLSLSRPRYFHESFDINTKLVILRKMIDVFQKLISVPPDAPARHIEPLMDTLRNRVRRAGTSLRAGWEYDLDDFVYYILSKRRIDKRIHQMLQEVPLSPTPELFVARLHQRYPEMVGVSTENIIDWYNNVIIQNGEVAVTDDLAVMSVRHFIRVLIVLQNELVKSVRISRITRRRKGS